MDNSRIVAITHRNFLFSPTVPIGIFSMQIINGHLHVVS